MIIKSTPAAYSSVHDDLIYTVTEATKTADPVTYPNYKFIADVYIDSVLVARIKKVQDPVTAVGIFNIGQIVRNYITATFDPDSNLLVSQTLGNTEFFTKVEVIFGEEYAYTSYYNLTPDDERIFFNNYNGRLVGSASSLTDKVGKVASNRPANDNNVLLTSTFCFIPYMSTSTAAVSFIVTPNVGSVYSTTFTPSAANILHSLNVAPSLLNELQAGTITAATKYYTVQIGSQTYRFNVNCEAIYTPYTLHFLNQYGGFESKIFQKVSRKTYEVEKKDFRKLPYTVDANGVVSYRSTNGVYNESRAVYSSQFEEKLTLNSDLLTDAEYAWLADLVFSPLVYIQDGAYFFPCIITERNYEPKKTVNDELTNLTLSVEYGTTLNTQYR